MTNWMLRCLVFGAAMVVVRLFQGTLISVWQTQAALISIVLLLLFIVGVVAWGLIDGREDAASNPDPDRRGGQGGAPGRSVRRTAQRRGDLADLDLLQSAVRRWADQRAHHVRGIHRPGGV